MKNILLTGGLGYIGSHLAVELSHHGYNPIILDNLSNCHHECFDKIQDICHSKLEFIECDILDFDKLKSVFFNFEIDSVIHLAAKKSVSESIQYPELYFNNNVIGTENLLKIIQINSIRNFIFSSSACVYDQGSQIPIKENALIKSINPYGNTKIQAEKKIIDYYNQFKNFNYSILRYFNPVGSHPSRIIGEDPLQNQSNLFPNILNVIMNEDKKLNVYGKNYSTKDGTPVRDYIHISDIADGHIKSMNYLDNQGRNHVINIGNSMGYTVLDVILTFENLTNKKIPINYCDKRDGDVAVSIADNSLSKSLLSWAPKYDLDEMCKSALEWKQRFPKGYLSS